MSQELLETYFQEIVDPKDILYNWRKKSWDRFESLGLPKRKEEAFQYLSLKELSFPAPSKEKSHSLEKKEKTLFFKNGFFVGGDLPAPLVCLPLPLAMHSYGIFLQNRFSKTIKEEKDPFAALNGAVQGKAAFLYVPPRTEIKEPIFIDQKFSSNEMSSPRIQLYLGKGASLKLIHKAKGSGLCNLVIDVVLDQGAKLSFYELPNLSEDAHYLFSFRASLKRDSHLSYFSNHLGSKLSRSSLNVELIEENAEVVLQGLSQLEKDLQNHIHATVKHEAKNTRSRQHFKSILKEKSLFSFEGKIFVSPEADKTEAYQLSNNLLLSEEAKVNAKPNLEIFADDVKASHGATIGQLDSEALFYLCSRGLSLEEAKKMLSSGFCRELLDPLPLFVQKELP